MYNIQSKQILCQTQGATLQFYDVTVETNSNCNTANSNQLYIYFSGNLTEQHQQNGTQYSIIQNEG